MSFLVSGDLREVHLRGVIRVKPGEYFYAGILNGPMGKALVTDISDKGITFNLELNMVSPPLYPVTLLLGMPRPIMAKRILREAAALGVGGIRFFKAEKGEPGYANSSFYREARFLSFLSEGAVQAFSTHLPDVKVFPSLRESLCGLYDNNRLALDNYEAGISLGSAEFVAVEPLVLALGPERGWSVSERDLLRNSGFRLVHLGPRVLKTETACIAAVAIVLSRAGFWQDYSCGGQIG